jgi:uncharacterized protein (DUF2252 family)
VTTISLHQSRRASHGSGRRLRDVVDRGTGADWAPAEGRRNPVDVLVAQDADRIEDLVPIRYGRMSVSPFTFLRGSAAVMAADLAGIPTTGLTVQACGDAHLSNFGAFDSAERRLVFDINDFDETFPAAWEHDVRRLAASVVVAARDAGVSDDSARIAVAGLADCYRKMMHEYAQMQTLEVWYSSVGVDTIAESVHKDNAEGAEVAHVERQAAKHDNLHAIPKLSELVGGTRTIREHPPLVRHVPEESQTEARATFLRYVDSLPEDRQDLLRRYTMDDVALKVVGVGSVGTRCFIMLLHGRDLDDPLVLQVKQATNSVLERPGSSAPGAHHGRRVVLGQRRVQGEPDITLGWTSGPRGRHYYVRQLWDANASFEPTTFDAAKLRSYSLLCAWALARAHARTGDPVALSAYLGKSTAFDEALVAFAVRYADQTERDHAELLEAIRVGRVHAVTGL